MLAECLVTIIHIIFKLIYINTANNTKPIGIQVTWKHVSVQVCFTIVSLGRPIRTALKSLVYEYFVILMYRNNLTELKGRLIIKFKILFKLKYGTDIA
jgi:hypothetical protein